LLGNLYYSFEKCKGTLKNKLKRNISAKHTCVVEGHNKSGNQQKLNKNLKKTYRETVCQTAEQAKHKKTQRKTYSTQATMATGDKKNAMKKLQYATKSIRYMKTDFTE
jgi:hypothetical protein